MKTLELLISLDDFCLFRRGKQIILISISGRAPTYDEVYWLSYHEETLLPMLRIYPGGNIDPK